MTSTNSDQYTQFFSTQNKQWVSSVYMCNCEFWWKRVPAYVNFIANSWYDLLRFRTAPARVFFSHTWRRKSSRTVSNYTDNWWTMDTCFFLAICCDVRCVWGAPSWLRRRSLTSLTFAAVREVLGLPLSHFQAFVHYSFKCFRKSFKLVFFHRLSKYFQLSLRSITFELIQLFY